MTIGDETQVPLLHFPDGTSVPAIAYGTGTKWFKRVSPGEAVTVSEDLINAILTALREGYRHIDTAEVYNTEEEVGIAIERFLAERPELSRKDLFVTTKVYRGIDDIHASLSSSLAKLKLDYVDLYLIHAPFWDKDKETLLGAWAKMESEKKRGRVKQIGVSNWRIRDYEALKEGGATELPVCNQIEYHPFLAAPELLAYHQANGPIITAAYGPLSPLNHFAREDSSVLDIASRIAEAKKVSPGEVLLAWALKTGALVVTTSADQARIRSSLKIAQLGLSDAEVEEIRAFGSGKKLRRFWANEDFN